MDIFSTDRTPLISPNLHTILFKEGKSDASRTEKKKNKTTLPHQNATTLKKMGLHPIFSKRMVNKSPENSSLTSVLLFSGYFLFSETIQRFCLNPTPGCLLYDFFLRLLGNIKNAEDACATQVMQKYSTRTTTTVPFSHYAASRSS